MDEEEEHSPREVSNILNIWKLLMQKVKKASPKARGPKTILSTNRKVQTQARRLRLIWTLYSATSKLMVWKMRKLKFYLRPSLTTFCRNLFERTEAKRRRIRAGDSFQFSAQYKLTAILRRNIHLTYPRTMSSKNPEMSLQRGEIHLFWHEHGKGNKPQAPQAIDEDEENALFVILNSATSIQLRFKELCGGFYTTLRSPSKRISVKQSVTVFHRSSFYRCKLNIGSIDSCTFQIFHGNVKIVQNESKRRIVNDSDEDDWLWSYVCQLCPVSNLDFHLTLTWSIFQSRKYRLIDKKPFLEF